MSKPSKGLDAYDLVRAVQRQEEPGADVWFVDGDEFHHKIGRVYIDEDGDLILEETR